MIKENNLTDLAIVFHDELNPLLWTDKKSLKPMVRYQLLRIQEEFIKFIDIPSLGLMDITISGSNCAYTYTKNSDIDLHLIVNIPEDQRKQLQELFNAKKNQFNYLHNIQIYGIDVEVYVQDAKEEHISAGVYSVLDNKWIQKPKPIKVEIDDQDVKNKFSNYLSKILTALKSDDVNQVKYVKKRISSLRKTGLEREGEFSVENIVFKILRNTGYMQKLHDHLYKLQDQELSLI
jgi:hypothetical protein